MQVETVEKQFVIASEAAFDAAKRGNLTITDARSKLRGIPDGIRVLKSDNTVGVISSARFARSGLAFNLAAELRG